MTRRRVSEFNDTQDERQQDRKNDKQRVSRRSEYKGSDNKYRDNKDSEYIDMNESDKSIRIKDIDSKDAEDSSNTNYSTNPNTKSRASMKASGKCVHWSDIRSLSYHQLIDKAEKARIANPGYRGFLMELDLNIVKKQDLLVALMQLEKDAGTTIVLEGIFDIMPEGYGFVRFADCGYLSSGEDVYVSHALIRKYQLRSGDYLEGTVRIPKPGEKYFALEDVNKMHGEKPMVGKLRPIFEKLTPIYPNKRIILKSQHKGDQLTLRMIDLLAPIGFGQRAMVVAPPKTGKTEMLRAVAHAVSDNHPEAILFVLLVDERPEEVTDMVRSIKGEVISSTFDEPAVRHVQIAEITIERARRLVELGKDVVIVVDSLTRLARAYNTVVPSSGKVLSGGVEATALQKPKAFFGAARNIDGGGSLTIIATAMIETHSKMDEVIFEEFKGTGNSEVQLSRQLAERGTFPSIAISGSSTRRADLLLDEGERTKRMLVRRVLSDMNTVEATEFLIDKLKKTRDNDDLLKNLS